jgi:hypothetical protein
MAELDACDRRAEQLAKGLDREQINWRPEPDAWSIGQCLQHLYIADELYLPPISASLERRPQARVEEITPGWFGRWFIRTYIQPSSRGRARAPRKIAPPADVDSAVLESFLRSNQAVRNVILHAAPYDVNRIRFANPFVPLLRFTVGTGFEIISQHQARHLLQAERVKQRLNSAPQT